VRYFSSKSWGCFVAVLKVFVLKVQPVNENKTRLFYSQIKLLTFKSSSSSTKSLTIEIVSEWKRVLAEGSGKRMKNELWGLIMLIVQQIRDHLSMMK
jgi:hypothetical protein